MRCSLGSLRALEKIFVCVDIPDPVNLLQQPNLYIEAHARGNAFGTGRWRSRTTLFTEKNGSESNQVFIQVDGDHSTPTYDAVSLSQNVR